MAQFDLTADVWTEVIAAGGSSDQMIVLSMGEALVSLGAPDATTQAIKMGGASRRSLLDARIYIAPAGFSVWMRPIGGRIVFSTGASPGGDAPFGYAFITDPRPSFLNQYITDPRPGFEDQRLYTLAGL